VGIASSMFLISLGIGQKLDRFFDRWDDRIKISDERFQAEKTADVDRTRKIDILLNETRGIINDLLYVITVQLSNHTIHSDATLGDVNGNFTKLIKDFNTTNELERAKAVANIIKPLQEIKALLVNGSR
jgi:hypothetical protein